MSSVLDIRYISFIESDETPFAQYTRPKIDEIFGMCLGSRIDDDMLGHFVHLACLSTQDNEAKNYAFERMKVLDLGFNERIDRENDYRRFCHSLVTFELVMFLWSFLKDKTVISVASGGAFLEYLLFMLGIRIECSDILPPIDVTSPATRNFAVMLIANDISDLNADVHARCRNAKMSYLKMDGEEHINDRGRDTEVFFMFSLPSDSDISERTLKAAVKSVTREAKYIVFLGEHGTCGTDRFREMMNNYQYSGKLIKIYEFQDMLRFPGKEDVCTVYMIQPDTDIQTETP